MSETLVTQKQEPGGVPAVGAGVAVAAEPPRSSRPPQARGAWRTALLFLSPTLVVFSVFILFPILFSFYLSFQQWNMFGGAPTFVGLDNYARMAQDPEFWAVFSNTAVYTIGTVPLNMALALAAAFALTKKIRGRKFLRVAFFTPVIISWVSAAVIWRWVFDPSLGLANYLLEAVGLPSVNWMNEPSAAMAAIIIVGVWKTFGINMVLFEAGLSGIPEHYYEAAEIDGANGWHKFWKITVPLLSPTTLFILVLSMIGSFQVFDLVYVLTYGGPLGETKVLVFYLYEQAFQFFDMGYASAVAYVLFAVLFVLTLIQVRFFRQQVYDAT